MGISCFFQQFLDCFDSSFNCPLLCVNRGLLVICSNSYVCAKCVNCSDMNCGSLSFLTISGIPNLEKISLMESMIVVEVELLSLCISGYLEK